MKITFIQHLKCIYYKLKYYIIEGYTHNYRIKLNEDVVIATIDNAKIRGKVVYIDKIMCGKEFIANYYTVQYQDDCYLISDDQILCVLKC